MLFKKTCRRIEMIRNDTPVILNGITRLIEEIEKSNRQNNDLQRQLNVIQLELQGLRDIHSQLAELKGLLYALSGLPTSPSSPQTSSAERVRQLQVQMDEQIGTVTDKPILRPENMK